MCRKLIDEIKADLILRQNKEAYNQKKAEKIISKVDYNNIDPANKKENDSRHSNNVNARIGIGVDFLIEIVKSIGLSQLNNLINGWINPAEYNYSKEILEKVNEIEQNLEKLTRITQLQAYQQVLNDRRKDTVGLSTVSNSYYYQLVGLIEQYPDGNDPVFKEKVNQLVGAWSKKICCGTNVYYEVENLLKLYLNNNVMLNKSYPEIYDEIAYFSYPWETKGYAFRRALRAEDYYVILSNLILTTYYYNLKNDEDAKYHLEELEKLLVEYQKIVDGHAVQINPYMKCQIAGAEMQFENSWHTFDWINQARKCKDRRIDVQDRDGNGKRYLHYNDYDQEMFMTRDEAIAIYNYYGTKNWVEIFDDAACDDNKFNGYDSSKWNVLQGQISYDIHAFRKNKDQIFTWMFPLSGQDQDPKRDVTTHTIEYCNLHYEGTSQEAWPPLYITNEGQMYGGRSCGLFKVNKRGR